MVTSPIISRLLLFLLFLTSTLLSGQQVLVDSISRALEEVVEPNEKADLLLGLARAKLFLAGGAEAAGTTQQLIDYTLEIKDSISYGNALCYQTQSLIENPGRGYFLATEAYGIGKRHQDPNLMLFAIYHIAEHFIYDKNDFDSGQKWLAIGHSLDHDKITHKHRGNFHKVNAINNQLLGKKDSALYWYGRALEEFKAVGAEPNFVKSLGRPSAQDWDQGDQNATQVLIYLSRISTEEKRFGEADSLLQIALKHATHWGAQDLIAWVYEETAGNRQQEGKVGEAIIALEKALQIYQDCGALKYIAAINRNIGSLFMRMRNPSVALEYYERGYPFAVLTSDTIEMVYTRTVQGQAYGDLDQFDLAREYFVKAIDLGRALGDSFSLGYVFSTIGSMEIAAGNIEAAKPALQKSLQISQRYNDVSAIVSQSTALADIFLKQGQLDSSNFYLQIAEDLTQSTGGLAARPGIAELLARIAEANGDYPAALAHQRRYQSYQDSLFAVQSQQSLRSAQVRQNVADYRAATEAAKRESSLLAQRNQLYLALAGALLLLLLIGSFLFLKLRSARRQLSDQNQQLTDLNATKDRFFGIIAHDLRNPIVALQSADMQIDHYASHNDISNVKEIAAQVGTTSRNLGRLLDNLLNWALSQQGVLPYRPETINISEITDEVTELFLTATMAKKINLAVDVRSTDTVFADRNSLHAILRNLVGNAIKFTPRGGRIHISTINKKGQLHLIIKDDGIGISDDKAAEIFKPTMGTSYGTDGEKGTGLGLTLVNELTVLNKGSISFNSASGKGSTFTVVLPTRP